MDWQNFTSIFLLYLLVFQICIFIILYGQNPSFTKNNEKIYLVVVNMFGNIKKIREYYELTQREIAKILNISKSSYNYFETGEHIIPLKHLNHFCNVFHLSMDYVCGLTNINTPVLKKYKLNQKEIGKKIKEIRQKNNLTQKEIAKILNTSQSNISAYESGKTLILTAFLYNYAKYFDISIDYLTGRSKVPNIKIQN